MRVHPVHRANLTKMRRGGTAAGEARMTDRRPHPPRRPPPDARPGGRALVAGAPLLAVADLHLEKGSACAGRGHLVPPWDTRATLDRLAVLLRRYTPQTVLALGDSFHDTGGAGRLMPADAARLARMAAAHEFVWLLGNHDPLPPEGMPGTARVVGSGRHRVPPRGRRRTGRKSAATTIPRPASPPARRP